MTEWIADKEPNWLILLEEAEIREKNDLGVISCKNKSLLDEDIVELAQSGLVSKLALEWENNLKFVLRDDGSLSIEQGWYSDLVEEDKPKFFTMWINSEHTSYDFRTDNPEVTHWMPLPEPPKD